MGELNIPSSKCLICGLTLSAEHSPDELIPVLEKKLGPVDAVSVKKHLNEYTSYYEKEMGKDLLRFFVSFRNSFAPEQLADFKLLTNSMERSLWTSSTSDRRHVNIDPGYLDTSKVIVASTKDATYRIYLKDGIYAQPMLWYEKNSYLAYDWTYPDYRDKPFLDFFNHVRGTYKQKTKK